MPAVRKMSVELFEQNAKDIVKTISRTFRASLIEGNSGGPPDGTVIDNAMIAGTKGLINPNNQLKEIL